MPWIAVVLAALVVTITARSSVRWVTHVLLMMPALIGVVAVPVSGNAGQGPDHDYATSAAIVVTAALAILVGVKVAAALTRPADQLVHRVLVAEVLTGAVTLGYGGVLLALSVGPAGLFGTSYGRAGAIATTTGGGGLGG